MRFASLGSGSKGNATLIEAGETRLLVDCGFAAKETTKRLALLDIDPQSISAILVTHEHKDHIGGVRVFANRHQIPVYLTLGTWLGAKEPAIELKNIISPHQPFEIGGVQCQPFPVPHDAREPCQFTFQIAGQKLGILSDLGRSTPCVEDNLAGCDALVLEANHDWSMLNVGPYPVSLKTRVGGDLGHLNNEQAAKILKAVCSSRLQYVVAAHLSEQNNSPELVHECFTEALGSSASTLKIACQNEGFGWHEIV